MTYSTGAEWWRPAVARGMTLPCTPATVGQDSAVPFAGILVLTVVLLLSPEAFIPGLGHVRIALLAGAFAIATHCWTRFVAGRPLMRRTGEMRLVGVLLGWTIVTLPLSLWPAGSMQILLGDYLKTLAIFWLLSNTVNTLKRLGTVVWALSLTAAPLAATGLWNFLSHNVFEGRIVSYDAPMTTDPNGLAMVLNLILPLTVALFLISRRPMVRGFLAGLIALDVIAIVVTFSRGGFLTLATISLLYLRGLQKGRRWKWAVAALVLAAVAIPLLPSGYLDRLSTITNIQGDKTGSAQLRNELNWIGLGYAVTHPLVGAGLGMNVAAFCLFNGLQAENCGRVCLQIPPPSPPCLYVHNVYLEYAMDLGWFGLALFLLLLVSCVRSAARVRERCAALPKGGELASLAEAIRIAIVGFAVAALFYPWAYSVYFYYLAALAVAVGAVYNTEVLTPAMSAVPASVPRWT